jgi:hypothetical protein
MAPPHEWPQQLLGLRHPRCRKASLPLAPQVNGLRRFQEPAVRGVGEHAGRFQQGRRVIEADSVEKPQQGQRAGDRPGIGRRPGPLDRHLESGHRWRSLLTKEMEHRARLAEDRGRGFLNAPGPSTSSRIRSMSYRAVPGYRGGIRGTSPSVTGVPHQGSSSDW